MSTIFYGGREGSWKAGLTDAELEKMRPERIQAANRVREFYASGIRFFTKRAIADLVDQFDRTRKHLQRVGTSEGNDGGESHGQMLFLQGLDGETVEVENETGTVWLAGTTEHAVCERDTTTNQLLHQNGGQTLKATREAFDAGVKIWKNSEDCKNVTAALMACPIPDKITKVVAFACFSMSGREVLHEHSITQHALILTIINVLQRKGFTVDGDIRCYTQDPVYTDVDRAVLESHGIHVLEDPHGFLEVDDSSVVISFSPNVPVRQIVTDVARPAIMLWNKVKPEEEMADAWSNWWQERNFGSVEELEGNITDPESSRLRELIENEYVEIQELSQDAFGDSCVYVRRC